MPEKHFISNCFFFDAHKELSTKFYIHFISYGFRIFCYVFITATKDFFELNQYVMYHPIIIVFCCIYVSIETMIITPNSSKRITNTFLILVRLFDYFLSTRHINFKKYSWLTINLNHDVKLYLFLVSSHCSRWVI